MIKSHRDLYSELLSLSKNLEIMMVLCWIILSMFISIITGGLCIIIHRVDG